MAKRMSTSFGSFFTLFTSLPIYRAGLSTVNKISSLNFVNSKTPENEFVVQLLDTDNNNIQLELDNNVSGENYALGQVSETTYDKVKSNVNWQDKFNSHTKEGTNYGNMSLATTDTTNDSLTIIQEKIYDTLQLINSYQTDE